MSLEATAEDRQRFCSRDVLWQIVVVVVVVVVVVNAVVVVNGSKSSHVPSSLTRDMSATFKIFNHTHSVKDFLQL